MRVLETERLRLEPLRAEHAHTLFEGLSNTVLYEFISEEPPRSIEALEKRYASLESRTSPRGDEQWLNWVIQTKPDGRSHGYVQATVRDATANVAYLLFEESWAKGLAREAVLAVLEHLRGFYGVRLVIANVDTRNRRSIGLLRRLGFRLSVTREGAERIRGVLRDESEFVLRLRG